MTYDDFQEHMEQKLIAQKVEDGNNYSGSDVSQIGRNKVEVGGDFVTDTVWENKIEGEGAAVGLQQAGTNWTMYDDTVVMSVYIKIDEASASVDNDRTGKADASNAGVVNAARNTEANIRKQRGDNANAVNAR